MVDPISLSIGALVSIVALLAAAGLYLAGQRPAYMVDMREVSNYHRHVNANEALSQDVEDTEGQP